MADDLEPPPFEEEEEQKEEDDLFSDAKEKPSSPDTDASSSSIPATATGDDQSAEPSQDPFEGAGSEIKLDSDEEESSAPAGDATGGGGGAGREWSGDYASPFETGSKDVEPESAAGSATAPSQSAEATPQISVSSISAAATAVKVSGTMKDSREELENGDDDEKYDISITVTEPQKVGDGMSAYMVYRVVTKTTNPAFRKSEMSVPRRFSDFLGIHSKLAERHTPQGIVVPPAPEKSVIGMTKIKMSKEESGSADFVERRRAALERYLNRTAAHPVLLEDPDFKEFLEKESDLPRATSTSALSGAGVMRLFHKVGESFEKIAFKMDENDEWFEEKQQQIEALDQQLHKLHGSVETLVGHRRELSVATAVFAKSAAMLGNVEEHTTLSRALSQLAETEEKVEALHRHQADTDFYTIAELLNDYIALIKAVKEVFHERVKSYRNWKEAETTLGKKREAKAKYEALNKPDKAAQVKQEIAEWSERVEKGQEDFEKLSKVIRREVARFESYRVNDFKNGVIKYLQTLMENQQKMIKYWEAFLPEAKAIA